MKSRRFLLVEGKHNKFWTVGVEGKRITTTWGRVGTDGQSKTWSASSPAAAGDEAETLAEAKLKKGYTEDKPGSARARPKTPKAPPAATARKGSKPDKGPPGGASGGPWDDVPVPAAVTRELTRLGCGRRADWKKEERATLSTLGTSFEGPRGLWTKKDPLGQVTEVPPAVYFLLRGVDWPHGKFEERGTDQELSFGMASGGYDVDLSEGKSRRRCVLAQFAWIAGPEVSLCFDLLDLSPDPAVYSVAHDSLRTTKSPRGVSRFLSTIRA